MARPVEHRIFAVVLAAGKSQRFGSAKQLHLIDGEPMVRKSAALARAVCGNNTLLITGFEQQKVVAAADGQCQFFAINDDFASGIGSSIACAARSLAGSADAVIIMLADQPLISEDHVKALLNAWSGGDDEIMATAFADVQGPPILLPRSVFPQLAELSGDTGARTLLDNPEFRVSSLRFEPAAVDIDKPEDLSQLRNARN